MCEFIQDLDELNVGDEIWRVDNCELYQLEYLGEIPNHGKCFLCRDDGKLLSASNIYLPGYKKVIKTSEGDIERFQEVIDALNRRIDSWKGKIYRARNREQGES